MGAVYEEYISVKQPVSDRQNLNFVSKFVSQYYTVLSDSFDGKKGRDNVGGCDR